MCIAYDESVECLPEKEPICSVCKMEEEIELHCLCDCVIAKLIWEESGFKEELEGVYSNFTNMAITCLERLPWSEHGLLMTVYWSVWSARNNGGEV